MDTKVNVTIPENTKINGTAIDAGTYPMYDLKSSEGVPNGAVFVYYAAPSPSWAAVYYVFGMVCHCSDENHCSNHKEDGCGSVIYEAENGTRYCTCWQLDKKADITITYTTEQEQMVNLLSTYGGLASSFYNYVNLYTGTYRGNGYSNLGNTRWLAGRSSFVGLTLSDKTLESTPSQDNGYTARYRIGINENHYLLTLNDADLELTDQLSSSLTFVGGLTVISTDKNNAQSTLRLGEDYNYTYSADTHQLVITIKNPGTKAFSIAYDAQMLNPKADLEYYNSVKLSWMGEEVQVTTDTGHVTNVSTSGLTYMISILKTDELTSAPLANAKFGLYDAKGELMASASTNASGQVVFKTIAGASDNSLILKGHTLYYLQEMDAPEGYMKEDEKYYFYFCDQSETGCEDCSTLISNLPSGVEKSKVHKETTGSIVSVTNRQKTYDFAIRKVDQDAYRKGTVKTLSGAEFVLYYESPILDASGNETEKMNRYYAILDSDNKLTGWNAGTSQATRILVGKNGQVVVSGLNAGTYYLEEVTAPDGYNLLSDAIKITISMDGTITMNQHSSAELNQEDNGTYTVTVMNGTGYSLPETGGAGVMGYMLTGLLLCLGAIAFMVISNRRTHINR